MYIVYIVVMIAVTAVCFTATITYGDIDSSYVPIYMKGKWKVIIACLLVVHMVFSMIVAMNMEFKNEPKPKYEMIDQGHYYKMVPNNN